ncbi:MAG: hypothetical protein ACRDZQ_11345, partial [Acidimicrobiales bacterium]
AGQQWMLEGPLSEVVLPPHWTYIGPDAGLALFRNTRARGPLWVEGRHGGPAPAGASARVLLTSGPGSQTVGVTTSAPALLVRSVANYPGWSATVARTATGSGRTVPVVAVGLVQGVRVPAGTSIVTWTYRPRELTTGLEIAGGGLAGAAAVAVWIWLWRAGRWLARRWARRRRALREERAGPADVPPSPRGGVQPTPVA